MKTQSAKFIQRTAATLAAFVFVLVAGVCALSESKKVKAEYDNIYVDIYYAEYNGVYGYYAIIFFIDDNHLLVGVTYAGSDDTVGNEEILISEQTGDHWGYLDSFYFVIFSENPTEIHEIKSFSKNIKYNVTLSEECEDYLIEVAENVEAAYLKYVLIEYQITNENNESFTVEIYLNYSDSIKQYIEQQQAAENAIQQNENLKRQGAIMIVVIISMIIGFCVLLFTRSR